jgi:hypothetical protein
LGGILKLGKQNEMHQIAWPWLVLGIALMAVLTWFNGRPEAVCLVQVPWDKVAHGLIFGGITLTFGLSAGGRRRWFMLLFMAAFAAFDELKQFFCRGVRQASKISLLTCWRLLQLCGGFYHGYCIGWGR